MRRLTEDEVDTGELLQSLEGDTGEGTETVAVGRAEAVEVARGTERANVVHRRSDLGVLLSDNVRVGRRLQDTRESALRSLVLAGSNEVTGRFREASETTGEDDGPGELDTDGDSPRALVIAVLGSVDDDGGDEETDCGRGRLFSVSFRKRNGHRKSRLQGLTRDHPLVGTDNSTTNGLRGTLGLVHGDLRKRTSGQPAIDRARSCSPNSRGKRYRRHRDQQRHCER